MFVAMGVVISPILRVEGMWPMVHLINITCAVFMGPGYAFLCALLIGIIRMAFMGIPPLALTGAIFGAALSGILYKLSKGKIIAAVLGEIIGTGILGGLLAYPLASLVLGREGAIYAYILPFLVSTAGGALIAAILITVMQRTGALSYLRRILAQAA